MRLDGETLNEMRARLRNGRWNAIDPSAMTKLMPYDRWGHKRPTQVWRAQVSRWTGKRFEFDHCGENHTKKAAAERCAARWARQLNRESQEEQ